MTRKEKDGTWQIYPIFKECWRGTQKNDAREIWSGDNEKGGAKLEWGGGHMERTTGAAAEGLKQGKSRS